MDSKTEALKEKLTQLYIETAEDIVVRRLRDKLRPVESGPKEPRQMELRLLPASHEDSLP